MKIGITERGDAGINLAWVSKMKEVDGAILISKNFTELFAQAVLQCEKPLILHCTCTGYGGTELEPNVPDYKTQLNSLKNIIDRGFPAEHCVLRIDPIFPSVRGLQRVIQVIEYFNSLNTGVGRIRVSIVDEYPHVRKRYEEKGWSPLYGGNFYPSTEQVEQTAKVLNAYDFKYETCAENFLASKLYNGEVRGCISYKDLNIMDIKNNIMSTNPQNRKGCSCLSCKTELLTERKPCPNGCVYCFWK